MNDHDHDPPPHEPTPPPLRRRWLRRLFTVVLVHGAVSLVAIFVAFLLGWATFARTLPEPQGWHEESPKAEFSARDADGAYTLDDYLAQEVRVFAELDQLIDGSWKDDAARRFSRFNRASVSFPGNGFDRNWNRTTLLEAASPVGGAVMVHGLSDSPYSLRAEAMRLHARGWTVLVLRVPGHGTSPAALAEISWHDWAQAVRLAVRGLADRLPEASPLVLVGFSNGGALCLDYTLDAIESEELPTPDALVLHSPMVGITPFAKITRLHHLIAWIPAFEKVRWSRIEEEIDPYKYSSWPTNASEQAFLLTSRLATRLARLQRQGTPDRMPPVLTFQSVVDSTVSVPDLIRVLYERLDHGKSELVLFDLNRMPIFDDLLRNNNEQFIRERLDNPSLSYRLTLVTTAQDPALGMMALTQSYGERTSAPLDLRWPDETFSLSHGGVPIPPDDPILGRREATQHFPGPNLGSIQLRGENGVLRISESITMRLRYNPFYSVVVERTDAWLDEVLGSP